MISVYISIYIDTDTRKMDLVVLSISDISAMAGDIGVFIDIYRYRYMYAFKMDLVVLFISDISAMAGDIGIYRYI